MLRSLSRSRAKREFAVSSTLAIAVSLAAGGTAATAQSFQATSTVIVPGSATVATGANSTTVTVNSPSAVINWAPNDTAIGGGAINFQTSGTTATFVNNPGSTADFAVLNNILPTDATRAIQFNGTVISQLRTLAGASSIGGTVYFYSPGGILVGPSAVINVGNLGLSASPIAYNATTGAFGATGSVPGNAAQTVSFGQANPVSSVQIMSGAQINANTSDGSYVAIVAPMIANRGTIQVNGSAALVAADAATITFNPNGLFNVSVDVGTSASGAVITNSGTISGPKAITGAINHAIYLATAPKNTLISMLLLAGSTTGFDVAGAADVVGNAVVLSGGYDIVAGTVNSSIAPKGLTGGSVNIDVTGASVTSRLTEVASNTASVTSRGPATPTTLASALDLRGLSLAFVRADNGGSITVNGSTNVTAIDRGLFAAAGASATGGQAQVIAATGSTIALHGAFTTLDASSTGATSATAGVKAGDGTGGFAQVSAFGGGSITADGTVFVRASGQGGSSQTNGVAGGNGLGGVALAQASDANATLTFKSSVYISAEGQGGTGSCLTACTAEAGTGTGGTAQVIVQRGTTTPGGGSTISIAAQNSTGGSNVLDVGAIGYGGGAFNTNAGAATGGTVFVSVDSGNTLNLAGSFLAHAEGFGGIQNGSLLTGGAATGGNVNVVLHPGASFTAGSLFGVVADATGGAGDPDSAGTGSSGGDATGGFARIFSDGGNATFNGAVTVSAGGSGGFSGAAGTTGKGGAGTGGTAIIASNSQTAGVAGTITLNAPANVVADGHGGSGYPGGIGTGGLAQVRVLNGKVIGTDVGVESAGFGGNGASNGAGGNGIGGLAFINARNNAFGPSTISFVNAQVVANGQGGRGGVSFNPTLIAGAGGAGYAGSSSATADAGDGNLTISGRLSSRSDAFGGNGGIGADNQAPGVQFGAGGNGGAGGAAFGFTVDPATGTIAGGSQNGTVSGVTGTTANGQAHFGTFFASGSAAGGQGGAGGNGVSGGTQGNGGAGGNALNGVAGLLVRGSTVTIDGSADVVADAIGGNGGAGNVAGGGGSATVGGNGGAFVTVTNRFQVPSQRASLTAGTINVSASAFAGTGAIGGQTTVDSNPLNFTLANATITAASLNMFSSATNVAANALPSFAQLSGGTANLGSAFQFNSSGPITVALDTATLNAGFVGLSGSDWILPTTPPVLAGTINATTGASFFSGKNTVTYANVNFGFPVLFNVIGNFQLGNVTTQGDFASVSGGTTTLGSINAVFGTGANSTSPGNVDISAGNAITVGPVVAAGYVSLDNTLTPRGLPGIGNVSVAGIVAGRDVGLFSNGSISAPGLIQAGANVDIQASGSTTIGNVSAGLVNRSTTPGDTFEIVIGAGGPLIAGNLASQSDIGLLSAQNISTGMLTGRDMLLLDSTGFASGAITASNRVLIADASMAPIGGQFGGNFDPNLVFNATPIRSAGAIGVFGPITAGQFVAASQQAIQIGNVTTTVGQVTLDSGTFVQTGNVVAASDAVLHASGAITTGTINAGANLALLGGGTMNTQGLTVRQGVLFADQSAYRLGVTTGAYNVGGLFVPVANLGAFNTTYRSTGAVAINGNVNATYLRATTAQTFQSGSITVPGGVGVDATGAISTGTILGAFAASLVSGSNVTTGDVDVGLTQPPIFSNGFEVAFINAGGNVTTGNVKALNVVSLTAGGALTAGLVQAGDNALAKAGTNLSVGNVTAGIVTQSTTPGATFNIGLTAGGTIAAGNLQARNTIGLFGQQAITTGTLSSVDLLGLGSGGMALGPINATGRVLLADLSMAALGVTPGGFDPNLVFNATPVQSTGAITVNGAIQTGQFFTAATQQGFTSGAITTGTDLTITAVGAVLTGAINSGGFADISSGALNTGPVTARRYVRVRATGPVTVGGAIQSGAQVQLSSGGAISAGNITAGFAPQSTVQGDFYDINLDAGGALNVGNLQSPAATVLHSLANIQTGAIASNFLGVLGGGTVSTGAITSGSSVFANQSFYTGQGTGPYNGQTLLNAVNAQPIVVANVGTTGSISIGGTVSGNLFHAYSAQDISLAKPLQMNQIAILRAGGNITATTIQGGITAQAIAGGNVVVGDVTGGAAAAAAGLPPSTTTSVVLAAGGSVTAGNIRSFNTALVTAQQAIQAGAITTVNLLALANNTITIGPITATGRVLVADSSMAALGNTTAVTNGVSRPVFDPNLVFAATPVRSAGTIRLTGPVTAASFSAAAGRGFTSGAITASNFVDVIAGGNVLVNGAIQSGQETSISTEGGITVGDVTAGPSGGTSDPIPFSIGLVANGGPLIAGNLSGAQSIGVGSSGSITTGTLTGVNLLAAGGSTIATGAITMTGQALLASFAMLPIGGTVGGNGTYDARLVFAATPIAAPGAITINGAVQTGQFFHAATLQGLTSGAITTGTDLSLTAGSTLTAGAISAATTATLASIGAMQTGSITAGKQVTISADSFVLGSPTTPGTIVSTGGGLSISTAKALVVPTLSIFGNVTLDSRTALTAGDVTSTAGSATLRSGGTLDAGTITAINGIVLNSTGAGTVQALTSSGAIQFNSGATFTSTGNIVSANQINGGSTGNMALANVTASGGAGTVELASSQGNLTTGRISATTDVAAIAGGSLSLGQVTGRDLVLLAGSNVQAGAIAAGAVTNPTTGQVTGATGRLLIANASAGAAGGTFGSYNFNAVFNATGGTVLTSTPPRIGGTVNLTGTVNAQVVRSFSQGAMTAQVINAFGSTEVESGGLVTVGQRWTSPDITIRSNDIAILPSQVLPTITTTAGLSSGKAGTVSLVSLNTSGAFIGDGLTAGPGYALSNAETALVQSGTLTIGAAIAPSLATTMTIGNLSLTGPQAGSNVDNQQSGAVLFVTGTPQTKVVSGTIRVVGAVTAKGFLTANQLQFQTGTFELDSTAGSLSVTDSSNAQAGGIAISADRIHIAAASILDKLRVDPLYATRISDLNTPPTQPLANPVLSAAQLIFAPTQTLYIQNTGTTAVPAGFLVPLAGLTIKTPSSDAAQSTPRVSLVINGQFVGTSTTGGTGQATTSPAPITGATAFQQFVQTKPTGFTAESQFNGCVIAAGSCSMMSTPTPDLSTQIQVLQTPALPSAPAIVAAVQQVSAEVTADPQQQEQTADKPTEAEQKEEEKAQAAAKAPIAPPAPMIDTRPLSPPVSVDEPVAGGGNPALFGVGAAANPTEGGDK